MSSGSASNPAQRKRAFRHQLHHWLRWLHTYLSALTLLATLFFSVTGITLNHPEWNFGMGESKRQVEGTLSADCVKGDQVDWLKVVEQIRREQPVHGGAVETRIDSGQGSFSFKAPGFTAETFFDLQTRKYQTSIVSQGFVGVLNDLHRGRDSGKSWAWLIDVAGIFLTVVSVSGFAILFYLKKARVMGVLTAIGGLALVAVLAWLAAR